MWLHKADDGLICGHYQLQIMSDQPSTQVKVYPTDRCCYVIRRIQFPDESGQMLASLVAIPQRLFLKPNGEVYFGEPMSNLDQPVQVKQEPVLGPGGRPMPPQKAWQPMVAFWQDFEYRKEVFTPQVMPDPQPEAAPEPAAE